MTSQILLKDSVNNFHGALQFICEISEHSASFLRHILVSVNDVFYKPTDSQSYLLYNPLLILTPSNPLLSFSFFDFAAAITHQGNHNCSKICFTTKPTNRLALPLQILVRMALPHETKQTEGPSFLQS